MSGIRIGRVYMGKVIMSDRLLVPENRQAWFERYRSQQCEKAFRLLVEAYGGMVTGTAARMLGNGESAREVAQSVFADLARMAPTLPEGTAVGGWLHRHAVFLSTRQRRSERRRGMREAEAHRRWSLDGKTEGPPAWLTDLDEMLGRLPEGDRRVLVLRYLENQPLKSVAEQLGIGEGAAQKRATRALEKLRSMLGRKGFNGVSAVSLPAAVSAFTPSTGNAALIASAALRAAATSSIPTAGVWTTFLAMNMKPILTGAIAASVLTSGMLAPVIFNQREQIASLEKRLATLPPAPVSQTKETAAARPRPAATAKPGSQRAEYEAFAARYEAAKDRVEKWTKEISQINDAALKQRALDEMRKAMSSSDDKDVFSALATYRSVGNVEFDRVVFRPSIEGLLSHKDPELRKMALGFIAALPPDPGDLARVTAMANDTDYGVRKGVVASLFWLTKGDLTGDAGKTVLGILDRAETPSRSLIDTMWGAQFSPELEKKLVEFARATSQPDDEQLAYYAVYSCLSTQRNKGPECVDLLLERLLDKDSYNVGGRAAWGLGYGVQPGLGLEKKIADTAIKVWQNRTDSYLRDGLMKCVKSYGDESHAAAVEEIASAPAMGEQQKKELTDLAAQLRGRGN